jgi:hypothetical protein
VVDTTIGEFAHSMINGPPDDDLLIDVLMSPTGDYNNPITID